MMKKDQTAPGIVAALAVIMAVIMLVGAVPVCAYAEEGQSPQQQYTITIQDAEGGSIKVKTEAEKYVPGETICLLVNAASGYELSAIQTDPEVDLDEEQMAFIMPEEDLTITPVFDHIKEQTADDDDDSFSDTVGAGEEVAGSNGDESSEGPEETDAQNIGKSRVLINGTNLPALAVASPRGKGVEYLGPLTYKGTTVGEFTVDGETAFCMQHLNPTPETGTSFSDKVYSNTNVRKVLYYGWDGPEQWSGFKSKAQGYVVTSLALSYYYDGEDSLGILPDGTSAEKLGLTDFFNYIKSKSVPSTSMSLSESSPTTKLSSDKSYQMTEEIKFDADNKNTISIALKSGMKLVNKTTGKTTSGGTAAVKGGDTFYLTAPLTMNETYKTGKVYGSMEKFNAVVAVTKGSVQDLGYKQVAKDTDQYVQLTVDWSAVGRIRVEKVDAETGENSPGGAATLEGAEYTLYTDKTATTEAKDINGKAVHLVTDKQGKTETSAYLTFGTYYLKETKAPEGYQLSDEVYEVTLPGEGSDPALQVADVEDDVILGDLELVKFGQDMDDKDVKNPLKGVTFTITSKTTGETVEIITDDSGYASTEQLGNPEGNLPYDTYIVREKTPPEGYEAIKDFEITISEQGQVLYYILEDKLILSPVRLVKKDAETGKEIPLAGARFQLLDKNKEPIEMTVRYPSVSVTNTFKTDETGSLTLPEMLPKGVYYFREVEAPKGYLLNHEDIRFEVTGGSTWEEPLTVVCLDTPAMGKIRITKTDAETEKVIPTGAEFEVRAAEDIKTPDGTVKVEAGTVVDTVKTDENGLAETGKLYLGKYTVKETKAPAGYLLNKEEFAVTLSYKDQNTIVVYGNVTVPDTPAMGKIRITKIDVETEKVIPTGAEFEVRAAEDIKTPDGTIRAKAGDVVDTAKIGESGVAETGKLYLGKYTVKETKAPAGYLLNKEEFAVTLSYKDQNTSVVYGSVTVPDIPAMGKIRITKTDAETEKVIPTGAEFEVRATEDIVTPDGTVRVKAGTVVDTVKTGENGLAETGKLYLGKYTVKETKAPAGYLLNTKEFAVTLSYKDQDTTVVYGNVTVPDTPAMGKIRITKTDGETENIIPTGAEFEVRATEDIKTPDGTIRAKAGDVVDTVKIGESGVAETGQLYLGKYTVKETKAPAGYLLNKKEFAVTLSYKDQDMTVVYGNVTVPDTPAMGKIRITKTDGETENIIPTGAEFEVRAAENIVTPDGTVRVKAGTVVDTVKTGENGLAETGKLYLGKYTVKETKAPAGYLLNTKEFKVTLSYKDQETAIVYGDTTVPDSPAKGRIEIAKTDEYTGDVLANAVFEIRAAQDIVTPGGTVRAQKDEVVDTIITDEHGRAASKELYLGKYTVKEIQQPSGHILPLDTAYEVELKYKDQLTAIVTETLGVENRPTVVIIDKKVTGSEQRLSGVKFVIWNKDKEDPVDPDMTYKEMYTTARNGQIRLEGIEAGTYCVQEVKTVPGYAMDPETLEFTVTEDGRIEGLEEYTVTVENERTEITETNALDVMTGAQLAYPLKDMTIMDIVSMIHLQPGEDYVLHGVLADQSTGEPLQDSLTGDELAVDQEFLATEGNMDIEVTFENIDLSAFAGRRIVVFEYLYQDDIEIAVHNDPEDEHQQIQITAPELHTTAIDVESGTHDAIAKKDITIRDNVEYLDLIPGMTYTLRGIVMDQATGKPLLVDGKEIASEKEVSISDADGEISMDFTFDASKLNNTSVVIYEYLYYGDELIVSHEDINDSDQTVSVSAPKPKAVKTGDDLSGLPYIGALLLATGCMTGVIIRQKRRRKGAGHRWEKQM